MNKMYKNIILEIFFVIWIYKKFKCVVKILLQFEIWLKIENFLKLYINIIWKNLTNCIKVSKSF